MINVRKAFDNFKAEVVKLGEIEDVSLKLVMNNHPKFGSQVFWLNFYDECEDLDFVDLMTGQTQCDINIAQGSDVYDLSVEEQIELYGEWYEILAEYADAEDGFYEIPVEDALKALEYFEFDSYEVVVE